MEIAVLPFPIALLTVALVYRFLTPLLTGGKVALKPGIKRKYMLFSLAVSAAYAILFAVVSVGLAIALTPLLRDYDVDNDAKWYWIGFFFRLVVSQFIFFALTILAGRFWKGAITVEGKFNAWKAAWAPAIVTVSTIALASYSYCLIFPPQ